MMHVYVHMPNTTHLMIDAMFRPFTWHGMMGWAVLQNRLVRTACLWPILGAAFTLAWMKSLEQVMQEMERKDL